MSNYNSLKATINANVKTNNNQEITGSILNSVLTQMVNSLGAGFQYMGVATPSTNPGSPDQNVFYLAVQAGTYSHFGSSVVPYGISVLKYNGSWTLETLVNIDTEPVQGSHALIESDAVFQITNGLMDEYIDVPFSKSGFFLNSNGEETSFWNGACTDFVEATSGDVFIFTGTTEFAFRSVCGYNSSKQFVGVLYNGDGDNTEVVVTNPQVAYVRSCAKLNDSNKSFKKRNTESLPVISQMLSDLQSSMSTAIYDNFSQGLVTGKYVNKDGVLSSNSSAAYKEYEVVNGSHVRIQGIQHSNVAVLARKNDDGTYTPLLVGNTASNDNTISEYDIQEDMTLVVSVWMYNVNPHSLAITANMVDSNRRNVVKLLTDEVNSKQETLIQDIEYGFMFNNIAVIGDSLSAGRVEGVSDPGADYHAFTWLNFLSKRWRSENMRIYANAGATTATWISQWLPILQADSLVCDLYFIALGTNNEYNESNPSGDQANLNAYISRYNSIIDAVRAKAPNAAIILMSLYEKRPGNDTLEDIAATRMQTDSGVYYLDYANNAKYLRYSPEVNWRGHFSSVGYVYVASAINQILNQVIWDNKTKTFWMQFAKDHNYDPEV